MPYAIKLIGLANGEMKSTALDGKYLVEYDPTRPGVDPQGNLMWAHITATDDLSKAHHFDTNAEAVELWRKPHGIREDGLPNRPLTAFTVEIALLQLFEEAQ